MAQTSGFKLNGHNIRIHPFSPVVHISYARFPMQIGFQHTCNDNAHLDKAPRLTIRAFGILASNTVFVNSTNTSTNIQAAMLSMHSF